jgi:hypothetical protein
MKVKFDDIIRQRWEKRTFPVDDQHRDAMIKLLDQKKRRRIIPLWWIGSAVVTIALGIILVWSSESSAPQSAPTYPPTSSEPSAPLVEEPNPPARKAETHQVPPASGNAMAENSLRSANQTATKFQEGNTTTTERIKPDVMAGKKQNANLTTELPSQETIAKSHTITGPTEVIGAEHEITSIGSTHGVIRNSDITSGLESLEPGLLSFLNTLHAPDVMPVSKQKKIVYLYAEGGAALISASKPIHDKGAKLHVGAGLGYAVAPGLHLNASAGYMMQDGGFDFERSSTVQHSGFGLRSQFNRIAPDRLHFVYSRLGLQVKTRKHILMGYGGVQKLYGAQGYIDVYTNQSLPAAESFTQQYTWLSTNGLRDWHVYAGVGYGYRLTPRLTVIGGTDYYFTSIVKQDAALAADGYYWKGSTTRWQPFVTLNYLLYGLF